jgi:hypothetical protein
MIAPRCPHCGTIVFLEMQECPNCGAGIGYHYPTLSFVPGDADGTMVDGTRWVRCANWAWQCNWMVSEDDESGRCFACRLIRRRPASDDTIALEKLADTGVDLRRLLVQLFALRLPVVPYYEREGGLAFDLLSSRSGESVVIGHADGVITIDLAESLDAHREALRVRLGEPYRTMLGHFRHEVGHYYQQVLVSDEPLLSECRALFGDERASYSDALDRHYRLGAPEDWADSFISEYATMHPWEDFAESFAHYLHITDTLSTAAAGGLVLQADRVDGLVAADVVPRTSYDGVPAREMLVHWHWLSLLFNRVNHAMGKGDLYPFTLTAPVERKLDFVHRVVQDVARRTAGTPILT